MQRVGELRGELLLFYGADDGSIEPSEHARLSEALSSAKKNYGLRVFADAGHGFASRDRESFRPEPTAIAWDDTLRLFDRILRGEPPGSTS